MDGGRGGTKGEVGSELGRKGREGELFRTFCSSGPCQLCGSITMSLGNASKTLRIGKCVCGRCAASMKLKRLQKCHCGKQIVGIAILKTD